MLSIRLPGIRIEQGAPSGAGAAGQPRLLPPFQEALFPAPRPAPSTRRSCRSDHPFSLAALATFPPALATIPRTVSSVSLGRGRGGWPPSGGSDAAVIGRPASSTATA